MAARTVRTIVCIGFLMLLLVSSGPVCFAQEGIDAPTEYPLGESDESENNNNAESESENDKETDDDNIYEGKLMPVSFKIGIERCSCEWDFIHDDPYSNHNSPPPRRALTPAHS